jgi:hypothetical protein
MPATVAAMALRRMGLAHRARVGPGVTAQDPSLVPPPPRAPRLGAVACDVSGEDPHRRAVRVDVGSGRRALLFLTSTCEPCHSLWTEAACATREATNAPGAGTAPAGAAARLLTIVTPSPTTESRRRVAERSPGSATVVMSSETWTRYGVARAPWLVVVDAGVVVHDAPATPGDVARLLAPPPS